MQQHRVDAPPPPYPLWLYAAVHTGNPGDCEYYATCCDGAATVLEIGCGTGRISSALLRAGCRVTGIDCSAEAVAIANSRNVDARVADMRDFDLGRQFDVVIAPYNVLYCCLSEADLLATFRCIKSHLRADGRFIFDVYCADSLLYGVDLLNTESSRGPLVDEEDGPILHVEAHGKAWDVFEHSYWWPHEQRIDAYFRHVAHDDETVVANIPQRYLLSGEVAYLLGEAGLTLLHWQGDFDGAPFEPDAGLMIVEAGPAA